MLLPSGKLKAIVLVTHSLIAVAVLSFMWGLGTPYLTVPLIFFSVLSTGYARSLPRRALNLATLDSGFGVSVPPEVVQYFTKGLMITVVCIGVATVNIV